MQEMHKFLLAAVFVLIARSSNGAAIDHVTFLRQEGQAVVLQADQATLRVSLVAPEVVRIQATNQDRFAPSLMVQSGFVKVDGPPCRMDVDDSADGITIKTTGLTVKVTKSPFSLEVLSPTGTQLLKTTSASGIEIGEGSCLSLELTPEDHFFGFGYMRKCFDARGHSLTWTRSYRNNEATVPFFMNPRGYAFFSNNTWKNDFDFTHSDFFTIATAAGDLDAFVMVGSDFKSLLTRYTELTGKPQLVPKWALGLEHRARYYDGQATVLDTARSFRKHNIPCEIIGLEPGWEQHPYSMDWEWSSTRFPDFQGMINDLKQLGYKFDLWESGAAPKKDFLNPAVRQDWFAKRVPALADWGVDMFKQDDPYPRGIKSVGMEPMEKSEGEVEDHFYQPGELITLGNTFYTETVFEQWRKLTGRRPVIQFHAYNASVASQRWPYQWGGDFGTGWGLYNASLSGHPMANADARSPYLDARHLDFFMSAGPVNDCWAYCIEPWNYADRLLEGCRMYASLRVRLYPYLYTAMREAHETGTPIMRPMVLVDPQDSATYKIGSQFFLGDSLLVGTSVQLDRDGDHTRKEVEQEVFVDAERTTPVYLPRGAWIDYWTGQEHIVAQSRWVDCRFPTYSGGPLLVKQGAVIPLAQVKHHTEQWPDELLILDVFPGPRGSLSRLYEDDGITFGYEQGQFANTTFAAVRTDDGITIDLSRRDGNYEGKPTRRDYLLKIHSRLAPSQVLVDGQELRPQTKDKILFSAQDCGWYFDATVNKIVLKLHPGWRFVRSEKNPAGTYPLTPAEERVVFDQAIDHSGTAARIEIALDPDPKARIGDAKEIVFSPENTRVVADGHSTVKIGVSLCDENGNLVESADANLAFELVGGGQITQGVEFQQGRGELTFTAPLEPGVSQIRANGAGLFSQPLKIEAAAGKLQLVVNPPRKVAIPGKGQWLGKEFTIAVSARDRDGNRLATQSNVQLAIRDYRGRETIERQGDMINGEAEFRRVAYETRPEKFIITAASEGLEPAGFRAFDNTWKLPDDYMTNPAIQDGLEKVLRD